MTRDHRREDIFVSVCFADVSPGSAGRSELGEFSRRLAERYRYCEILLVVVADAALDHEPLLHEVANVRLLMVRPGTPLYRRRAAVASEAIGDIVALASIDEQPVLDILEMIELAAQKGSIVIGRRSNASLMNPALRALGSSAGFRVDMRDMLTAAYPRALLNKLLAHPDRELALRFPPSAAGMPVIWQPTRQAGGRGRSFREFGRRLSIVQKLLVSSAPRVLTLVSLLSLAVVLAGLAFALYAVMVWATLTTIQPGWFTTSLVLSLTAAFLGVAIFGLSIGLQKVIETLSSDVADDIVDERSAVDMFDQAMKELNVEIGAGHAVAATPPDPVKAPG
jgi:hypothetical protein